MCVTAPAELSQPRECVLPGRRVLGTTIHDKGYADAGQGERVRVPLADGTLVPVPGGQPDSGLIPSLLTLSDVMCTGHHAALAGRVRTGVYRGRRR